MTRTAIINGQTVENVILAGDNWSPPEGVEAVECGPEVGPGYTYADGVFTAPEPPPAEPVRVTKADFQRLLVPAERYAINALRRQIADLTVADYSDPANSLLVAAEDVLLAFEQPAEFIELDHPDTYAGLMLFSYLGVLTEARVNEIVAG
jgi:hypothetical protein